MTFEEFETLLDEALDFYNSTHSGAEIDAGVTGGLNAVRYDIGQNLAEMQKAQARSNLGIRADGTTGAVDSVNGKTGTVVLNGDDIYTNSQNTATIGNVLDNIANPNLLDNWYFGNPVNQRGQTSYTGSGYTIDRWRNASTHATTTIADGVIKVQSTENLSAPYQMWAQYLETPVVGIPATCSILITAIEGSVALLWGNTTNSADRVTSTVISTPGLYSITGVCSAGPQVVALSKRGSGANSVEIAASKLELGDTQTLAHQDDGGNWILNEIPSYAEQLARCQRFFYKLKTPSSYAARFFNGFAYNADTVRLTLPLPVPMRALPTLTVNNVTLMVYDGSGGSGVAATEPEITGSTSEADNSFVGVKLTVAGAVVRQTYMISVQGSSIANGLEFSADL